MGGRTHQKWVNQMSSPSTPHRTADGTIGMGFKTPLPPPEARQVRRFERLRPGRTGSLDPDDDETDIIIDLGPSGTTLGALTDEQRLLLQE